MVEFIEVRLENDLNWESILRTSEFNEDAVKEFCEHHREYFVDNVKNDEYKELTIETKENDETIRVYDVYIDKFFNFSIKEIARVVL